MPSTPSSPGGSELLAWARQQLGEDRVIEPRAEWRDGKEIELYRRELSDSFLAQLAGKGHHLDPETTRLELWGESFTGCVYGYGTALARHLGLKTPAFVDFDMTVPDERLLCKAELVTPTSCCLAARCGATCSKAPSVSRSACSSRGSGGTTAGAAGRSLSPTPVRADAPPVSDFREPRMSRRLPKKASLADPRRLQQGDGGGCSRAHASGITLYADLLVDRPNRRIPVEPVRGFEGMRFLLERPPARGWRYPGACPAASSGFGFPPKLCWRRCETPRSARIELPARRHSVDLLAGAF